MEVSIEEYTEIIQRLKGRMAPGPDGIPRQVMALVAGELADTMRCLMTDCLRTGRFPQQWKRASLVLLPKVGKPVGSPSAYRPICLLDEAAKLLERVVAQRLVQHLSEKGPDLDPEQYGFRRGRSTTDAILRVCSCVEDIMGHIEGVGDI